MSIEQDEDQSNQSGTWSILRDDFMMGARMKDWDKDSNGSGEQDATGVDHADVMSDSD